MNVLETRIPPPFVAAGLAALVWFLGWLAPGPHLGAIGWVRVLLIVALVFAGLALLVPAVRAFRRARTTLNPINVTQSAALVTSGIYARTRNPMYLGMALLLLAWAVWLGTPIGLAGPALFVAFITRFQIIPEERAMAAKFGAEFASYRGRTRRWL